MPRVPTEEEVLRARNAADWRGRADALAKAVTEFLSITAQVPFMHRDRAMAERAAGAKAVVRDALADYPRTE